MTSAPSLNRPPEILSAQENCSIDSKSQQYSSYYPPSCPPPYNISAEIDKREFKTSRVTFQPHKKGWRLSKLNRNIIIGAIATSMLLIATIIPLIYVLNNQENPQHDLIGYSTTSSSKIETTIPEENDVESSSASTSSSPPITTTTTATSPPAESTEPTTESTDPPDTYKFITRKEWGSKSKYWSDFELKKIRRIIVMSTGRNSCESLEECKELVRILQENSEYINFDSSPQITDIEENFLIAPDGTVFEGRGINDEGQHSYDKLKTSYNVDAIGVSFIGTFTKENITEHQKKSFDLFVEDLIENNDKIESNYMLFHRNQLIGGTNDLLSQDVKSWDNWITGETSTMLNSINS